MHSHQKNAGLVAEAQLSAPGISPCLFVEAAGRHIIFTSSPVYSRDHASFFFFFLFQCAHMEVLSGNRGMLESVAIAPRLRALKCPKNKWSNMY